MKTIIAGGRNYQFTSADEEFLDSIMDTITEVVEGGAPGADRCARNWAIKRGIPFRTFNADWDKYGNAAGPIRNRQMAEYAFANGGQCVLFPGGKGTDSMYNEAWEADLVIHDRRKHMSKRYRVRKKNAEKLERSREITDQFYDSVLTALEKELKKLDNLRIRIDKQLEKTEQERIIGNDEIMKQHLNEGGTPT